MQSAHLETGATLLELALERGDLLCDATGLGQRRGELRTLIRKMTEPWGEGPLVPDPAWKSHVVDDGTPFEFSAAFGKSTELRFMVEPLGSPPSLGANIAAGRELLERLSRDYPLDLSRFERVSDLFLPAVPKGIFGLWVAVILGPSGPPEFKLYLNPEISGPAFAPALLEEAMVRLGFAGAWPAIGNRLARRGPALDQLKYFSLDISPSQHARVKVYARHHDSSADVLMEAAAGCSSCPTDELARYLARVSDRERYDGRGPFTCYSFVGASSAPAAVTTHFPVNGYCSSDRESSDRALDCMRELDVPTEAFQKVSRAIESRPLDDGIGLLSYVSFRHDRHGSRVTVYLPSEAYAPGTVEQPRRRSSGVTEIVSSIPGLSAEVHPLVQRMLRRASDADPLVRLVQCAEVAVDEADAELGRVLDEVESGPLHELLSQLREVPDSVTRTQWIQRVGEALLPFRPAVIDLRPRQIGRRFKDYRYAESRNTGSHRRTGVAAASVLFATSLCCAVGDAVRRHDGLGREVSARLPTFPGPVPTPWTLAGTLAEADRVELLAGFHACAGAAWRMLNELYEVCWLECDKGAR